jgi:polar amino acid transport system substrate-binding protein
MDTKTKNIYMTLVFALFFVPFFSSTIFAAEVTVGFGYAKPPFVFALSEEDTEENRGIELQIMEEALAYRGHSMKAKYISNDKLIPKLQNGTIDAAATVSQSNKKTIYYCDEFVYFWNYAVTQPDDIKRISSIKELEGRKVLAWRDAIKDLGSDFKKATLKMAFYKEVASQEEQVLLFLQKKAGTLIIDWNIFSYWAKKYGYDPTNTI